MITFAVHTIKLMRYHEIDGNTKGALVCLNLGIMLSTVVIDMDDTMSLLYSLAIQYSDKEFFKRYLEFDRDWYQFLHDHMKMVHAIGLYVRNAGIILNVARLLKQLAAFKVSDEQPEKYQKSKESVMVIKRNEQQRSKSQDGNINITMDEGDEFEERESMISVTKSRDNTLVKAE